MQQPENLQISPPSGLDTRAAPPQIAVIGCGSWGRNLVRNFAALGSLAAICDPNVDTANKLAQTFDRPPRAWRDLLSDPRIEACAIAAPAANHHELAREALMAGKHVFVEKPIALDVVHAEELIGLADQHNLRLMVGHLLQYHPAYLKLKELVREGMLGKLRYVYSNRLNLGKIRREEDALWSFAPHDISMILGLLGGEPTHVSADGGAYLQTTVADVTNTHLTFRGGEQAHIFVSWLHPFKEQKLVVIGDRAMAVFNDGDAWQGKLKLYRHRIEWKDLQPVSEQAKAELVALEENEPLSCECAHFLECVATGATPRTDGREGLRVLKVLAAASASLKTGGRVELSPTAISPRFPGVRIHESAYVDDKVEIGAGSSIWHFSHLLPNTTLGRNVSVGQNVMIGPDVTIGNRCKIQNNVSLYKGVVLEDGVFCGPSCVFTNVNNPRAEIERKSEFRTTLVRRGATIGANATIVCGLTLGRYSFVAAGAVVTGDVPDFALVAGVPARRIGWMSRAGGRLGPDLICPVDGSRYRETAPDILEEVVDA